MMKNRKLILLLLMTVTLIGCGITGSNKIEKPARPRINQHYQDLLMQAGPETAKEAQKHEWDWHGYADKLEKRAGY